GEFTLQLAARAPFVVGLDISPTLLALARQRQREVGCRNVAWVIARAEEPPFRPNSIDYIASAYVVRLTDMPATLSAVRQLIRPGGRVAIRDRLMPPPRLGFWITHVVRTLRLGRQWVREYGVKSLGSILAYRLSPAGLRHARRNAALTRAAFETGYARE